MSETILAVSGLSKHYGATTALSDVSIDLRAGEVHAILGENGAGKSTLVKVLSGVVRPNTGQMTLNGKAYTPATIAEARRDGVATAFQELSLISNLTVGENLLLPRSSKSSFWPERKSGIMRRAAEILAKWEVKDIAPDAIVEDLSLAERQRIEIARALSHAQRMLILDEPTAALPDPGWLFRQIRRLATEGVAVMYISHRLGEVREICQRATVLRNGATIGTVELSGVDDDGIFAMMVGHRPEREYTAYTQAAGGRVLLEVEGLKCGRIRDFDLTLRAGEIVGVAGLEGQGQQDLFGALGGLLSPESGRVMLAGQPISPGSPRRMLTAGLAYVPEERKTEGIFDNLSAAANITLPRISEVGWAGLLTERQERHAAAEPGRRVALSERYLGFSVGNLSGGNQQKVLLARALMTGAPCLVLFDPARGVDVGTKQSIYAMMRRFVADGGTILFYSSELSELVHLCTRCLVLYGGKIVAEMPHEALSEESLVAAAHGPQKALEEA